ncbi:peptidylprolyl isomerase [Candidatus Gracilibacteria bacterium]|nr:peptidylprolyl isomerase [Candidatus Gracilibacteria bacterium]
MTNPKVQFITNFGDITLKLFLKHAPKAVENFIKLCEKGYYDGITFHRVIRDFMIQGGDPSGDGTGGKSIWGKPFEDEFCDELTHKAGTLSMANAGPNTNGSQFFIVTMEDASFLDGKHTIFGEVTDGMEVVRDIESLPTDNFDRPKMQVIIEKATVL